jgi:hypothetical protein
MINIKCRYLQLHLYVSFAYVLKIICYQMTGATKIHGHCIYNRIDSG